MKRACTVTWRKFYYFFLLLSFCFSVLKKLPLLFISWKKKKKKGQRISSSFFVLFFGQANIILFLTSFQFMPLPHTRYPRCCTEKVFVFTIFGWRKRMETMWSGDELSWAELSWEREMNAEKELYFFSFSPECTRTNFCLINFSEFKVAWI